MQSEPFLPAYQCTSFHIFLIADINWYIFKYLFLISVLQNKTVMSTILQIFSFSV